MRRLIRSTGEDALRPACQYQVPRDEVRFFAACIIVRGAGGVIIRTLHEIDVRARRNSRSNEGSLDVEIDAPADVRIGIRKCRQRKRDHAPSTSIWLKTTICSRPPMPFIAKFPQSPRQFDRASVFRGNLLAYN